MYLLPWERRAEDVTTVAPQLSAAARASLRREGLQTAPWLRRLRGAPRPLIRFIARFHRVPGFALVVRAAFGDERRRRLARLAVRAAGELGASAEERRRLRFVRTSAPTPDGTPRPGIDLHDDGDERRYRLLPWSRFRARQLARQLRADAGRFAAPARVRYLLDGDAIELPRATLVRRVRRAWHDAYGAPGGRQRRWLEALDEIVELI